MAVVKGKGTVHPITGHEGPQGVEVLPYSFFNRDTRWWVVNATPRPLYPTKNLVKGKATPLQALTGPEGSRRLRLPDFMTIGT
jgi:hypothetical protein